LDWVWNAIRISEKNFQGDRESCASFCSARANIFELPLTVHYQWQMRSGPIGPPVFVSKSETHFSHARDFLGCDRRKNTVARESRETGTN
jgi:outer membrane lipopolysaccharide assembly protein LptE/RlpB